MIVFEAVPGVVSRTGRKRKLPWLEDGSAEDTSNRHCTLRQGEDGRQPTEHIALVVPPKAPPEAGFFKRFMSPGGAASKESSSSSSQLSRQKHHGQHAESEASDDEDGFRKKDDDHMSASEVPPAEFLVQLSLNMQRSRQLEADETALRSALAGDDTVLQRRLAAKVRIASSEQRSREADLYRIADADMPALEEEALFQDLGVAFADRLNRNCEPHLAMEEESTRVTYMEELAQEKRQGWDSLAKSYAVSKLLNEPEDEFGQRLTLETYMHDEHEAGVVHADALLALERLFETCRHDARLLCSLADPVLVSKGLLPLRTLATADPHQEMKKHSNSQVEPVAQKQPTHDPALPVPGDQKEQSMTMTENTVRDINQNFGQAYRGLAEATARLENVRGDQRKLGNDVLTSINEGRVTSTQTEFDRHLYHLRKNRNHEVVVAEQALDHAKQTARVFGVLPPNQTSGFRNDYPGDVSGNADSDVVRMVDAFDPKKVEAWRRGVTNASKGGVLDAGLPVPQAEWPDVDDYDAASLALGASLSTVAVGKMRAKVDRLRQPSLRRLSGHVNLSDDAWYPGRGFCNGDGTWQ